MTITTTGLVPTAILRRQEWARKKLGEGNVWQHKGFMTTHRNSDEQEVSPDPVLVDDRQEFDIELAKAEKHSIALKKARAARREELLSEIETMDIQIPVLDAEELLMAAIKSYNDGHTTVSPSGWLKIAETSSDEAFLHRIQVNYIRHKLTNYDLALGRIANRPGCPRARTLLRRRVHAAISEIYPYLDLECRRQNGASKKTLMAVARQDKNAAMFCEVG